MSGTLSQLPAIEVCSPLYKSRNGEWRALSQSSAVAPSVAYSYISRSFRQTAPHVLGAMRLLANTFPPAELSKNGFGIYADFRPQVEQWGGRSEISCEKILELRRSGKVESEPTQSAPNISNSDALATKAVDLDYGASPKKMKAMLLEDYEAVFDEIDDSAILGIELQEGP